MSKQIKVLNKFNGNICFVGATDTGDIIFECDRYGSIVYDHSSKLIKDIDLLTSQSYLVAFGDNWLGSFESGILTENWLNTGISSVDSISISTNGDYYLLNNSTEQLIKYNGGIIWTFDLPINPITDISFRNSDGVIICHGDNSICVIRDDTSKGTLLNILNINGNGSLNILNSGEFGPLYGYVRARQVTGRDLDQSSSSSLSSSSSSSKSSSSSEGYSTSSSSSSEGYSTSSSSSSGKYSTSSSSSSSELYSESSLSSSGGYSTSSSESSGGNSESSSSSSSSSELYSESSPSSLSSSEGYSESSSEGYSESSSEGYSESSESSSSQTAYWEFTAKYGLKSWDSVTASSDISKIVAIEGRHIHTSIDYGENWTDRGNITAANWCGTVKSSSIGDIVVTGQWGGYIYGSSDYGATWTARTGAGSRNWIGVTCNGTGGMQVAVDFPGYIYCSTNAGLTWTEKTSYWDVWRAVAASYNATKLYAVGDNVLRISTNYGANWSIISYFSAGKAINSIACSYDGTKLVASDLNDGTGDGGYLYTSTDSGLNWTARGEKRKWKGVASSSDGTRLFAIEDSYYPYIGGIYASTDSGITWDVIGRVNDLTGISCSSDGTKIVIVNENYPSGGYVYTGILVE